MRTIIFLSLLFLVCCKPDDAVPTTPVMDPMFDESKATLVKQGEIMGVNHSVSGTASIYEDGGRHTVVLNPFSSQNGPDLKIYLSKDVGASEYVRLGDLKSTTGKQAYSIPPGVDINNYSYVHVWCEEFSVEFARAQMK